jgi:hypothetical protein
VHGFVCHSLLKGRLDSCNQFYLGNKGGMRGQLGVVHFNIVRTSFFNQFHFGIKIRMRWQVVTVHLDAVLNFILELGRVLRVCICMCLRCEKHVIDQSLFRFASATSKTKYQLNTSHFCAFHLRASSNQSN